MNLKAFVIGALILVSGIASASWNYTNEHIDTNGYPYWKTTVSQGGSCKKVVKLAQAEAKAACVERTRAQECQYTVIKQEKIKMELGNDCFFCVGQFLGAKASGCNVEVITREVL